MISNSSKHPIPERTWRGIGWLNDGYTRKKNFSALPQNSTFYPLWNAADFRRTSGNMYGSGKIYVGYHFHNFFPSVDIIRKKYKTYGHPVKDALEKPLGGIHEDLQSMINCGLNRTEEDSSSRYPLVKGGLKSLSGTVPLAFMVPGYVELRQRELRDMLKLSEENEASSYAEK